MEHSEEKRREERFSCGSPVEWAYFNKPERHNAQMRNFSLTGACFECSQQLIHGATIQVRLEAYHTQCGSDCLAGDKCPWPRSVVLGDVRWCRGIPGSGPARFGVGVKFHLQA